MIRPALIFIALWASPMYGDEILGPGDYIRMLEASPLRYDIRDTPAREPVEQLTCGRREHSMRRVADGGGFKLVAWPVAPEAAELIEQGERLYERKEYDAAGAKYRAALLIDPEAVQARLFHGDTLLFGRDDAAAALSEYLIAIDLDPSLAAPHFFASTAYRELGRIADARNEIVRALSLDPAYDTIWKIAAEHPEALGIEPVVRHPFDPPAGLLGSRLEDRIDVFAGTDLRWLGYAVCKAAWRYEDRFEDRRAKDGGWSLAEERACIKAQLLGAHAAAAAKIEEERGKEGLASEEVAAAAVAALPPLERHLYEVAEQGLLDGYVLFEVLGRRCPRFVGLLDDSFRAPLEAYVRRYVIVGE